jgi:cell division protein FtsB
MQGLLVRIGLGVFGLLTVAMLLLAVFNDKGVLQVRARAATLAEIQAEVAAIEAENAQLTAEIKSLRTDPAAIEKLAREELNLVKPDEIILITP